ncbi:MAG: hypothetical protein ACI9VR_000676 [Cognaticolwellia sp.]|jgi:uncharacterized protein (TIGR00299 family) protein
MPTQLTRAQLIRTLWIDARAGLAGDMLCAALLQAGGDLSELQLEIDKLALPALTLRTQVVTRGAFSCLHFKVLNGEQAADADAPWQAPGAEPGHDHGSSHDHSHSHSHDHSQQDTKADPASWQAIRARITQAGLPKGAEEKALAVFQALALAEAQVHGMPVDQVTFHEVGAADSIADIVSACVLIEQLGITRILCTELPMGGGPVNTAHGKITAPAPATVALLKGWPCFQDGRLGELVTPTGAALVATLATPGPMPTMRPLSSGFGAGTWNPSGWGNHVRVVLGESGQSTSQDLTPTSVLELQTQVDDMRGEEVPALLDALFAAGALDAWTQQVSMKKGRPALLLSALCRPQNREGVSRAMLRHSTSFGLRVQALERDILRREHVPVQTAFGPIRIKVGWLDDERLQASPEHEDCAHAALAHDRPLRSVYAAAQAAYRAAYPE